MKRSLNNAGVLILYTLLFAGFSGLSPALYGQDSFDVVVGMVDESHPNFGNTHPEVYIIDGVQGAELNLIRGITYEFHVSAFGHPFFLSENESWNGFVGEITEGVENSRVEDGTLTFTPGDSHPDLIYYQCGAHAGMGWKINIADEADEEAEFIANLSGSSEVPPVFSASTGFVEATLEGNMLTLSGGFEGLSSAVEPVGETGVHIHSGYTGENGPVEIVLNPELSAGNTAGTFDETVSLNSEQVQMLLNRQLYINVHSENYPAGEIRGQLLLEGQTYFKAYASGGYEVPPNTSTAQGGISVELNGSTLVVTGAFSGLTGDYIPEVGDTGSGAHLHVGFAGENGPVDISLTPVVSGDNRSGVFTAADNTFNISTEIASRLLNRELYLNIHSEPYPAGELRGQVLPDAAVYFYAPLSGAYEVPQNPSRAAGAAILEWYPVDSEIVLTGAFTGLESDYNTDVGSHIHVGYAGENGGVDFVLDPQLSGDLRSGVFEPADNTFTLSSNQQNRLFDRRHYVNIHTEDLPAGEIRGQLLPLAQYYFYAPLTGLAEVDPVETQAEGGIVFEFRNGNITGSGSFSGLSSSFSGSPGAHIHEGFAGVNGDVVIVLDVSPGELDDDRSGVFLAVDNTYPLEQEDFNRLLTGELYVNVHSEDNPAGEIRGQMLLAPNRAPESAPEITFPDDGATVIVEGNNHAIFAPAWTASDDPDGDLVVYIWQAALDEGFEDIVISVAAGENPSAEFELQEMDALLASLGLEVGDQVDVWHRAAASDGSASHFGSAASLTLERGLVTSINEDPETPLKLSLEQNYPNPFNPATVIAYSIPQDNQVRLEVFDVLGRQVAVLVNERQRAGQHFATFNAGGLSSGVYMYRLEFGNQVLTGKMMLIK